MSPKALKVVTKRYGRFFSNHGRMIFFVLFLSVVIGAVAGLNTILFQPSDEVYRAEKLGEAQSPRFDKATIQKIQKLNSGQQTATEESVSAGRTNPFGE